MPPSQLAKVVLDVSTDHLWTIQSLIKARQLQTFAFRSLLRTALVGATQTVWLLAPEDRAMRTTRAAGSVGAFRRVLSPVGAISAELADAWWRRWLGSLLPRRSAFRQSTRTQDWAEQPSGSAGAEHGPAGARLLRRDR